MAKKLRLTSMDVDAAQTLLALQANGRRYSLLIAKRLSDEETRHLRENEFVVIGVKRNGRLTMQSGPTTVDVTPHRDEETWELRTASRLLFIGGPGNELHRWLPVPWYKTEIEYWANRLGIVDWLNRRRT